jgi:peptidoglycan hydrolase FlgJ
MSLPIANSRIYGDFAGLEALKKAAHDHDPGALRQVAQAFESLFARMLIKSMRDAVGRDPIFGSDQEQAYQQMYDDQLSMQLTRGHGLGLADMLVRQLQGRGEIAGNASPSTEAAGPAASTGSVRSVRTAASAVAAPPTGQSSSAGAPSTADAAPAASATDRTAFVRALWPQACEAARQLGVAPQSLVAQAALETHWGCSIPQDTTGRSSNNLFGMKASGGWQGADVTAATHEMVGGTERATAAQFRAYTSTAQSFTDYVALLKSDPRYSAALGTGSDVQSFASALQRGGYATDPDYARKVTAVAHEVSGILGLPRQSLKLASAGPISPGANPIF